MAAPGSAQFSGSEAAVVSHSVQNWIRFVPKNDSKLEPKMDRNRNQKWLAFASSFARNPVRKTIGTAVLFWSEVLDFN